MISWKMTKKSQGDVHTSDNENSVKGEVTMLKEWENLEEVVSLTINHDVEQIMGIF